MAKKIFYDDDARQRVLGGAKALYDAVKVTMGPKGRNVVIGKSYGGPTVTHDGVSVAKAVDLPEEDDETLGYKVGAENERRRRRWHNHRNRADLQHFSRSQQAYRRWSQSNGATQGC
jgi:hypothetical protein